MNYGNWEITTVENEPFKEAVILHIKTLLDRKEIGRLERLEITEKQIVVNGGLCHNHVIDYLPHLQDNLILVRCSDMTDWEDIEVFVSMGGEWKGIHCYERPSH